MLFLIIPSEYSLFLSMLILCILVVVYLIIKKRVIIDKKDNVDTLKKKVQFQEYKAYSSAIRKIFSSG